MRALLISPELFRAEGGIARIMRLYVKALCAAVGPAGTVDVLVLNDPPEGDPRLARYADSHLRTQVGCDRSKARFVWHALGLARKNDVVVCGHLHQLPVAWLARCFKPRLKYYLVAHGIDVWRPFTWLERRALRGAHRILCVSEYTRRQMLRFFPGLAPERVVVVPNTLDPFFSPDPASRLSATPFSGPRILCVTRLSASDAYKGVDTLIEALPQFRREFPLAQLRVVGQGDDLPRLLALAAQLGVISAVTFTGALSDQALRNEYTNCDLFALPSRKEGFGLVFLEAMTCGKPCLGVRAGGAPEVINDRVGRLVDYGNIPELAAGLADLVRHPRDPEVVRHHADNFAFAAFARRLAAALA
jgi:glycosyltransferase involved in cell wall biosynthesis